MVLELPPVPALDAEAVLAAAEVRRPVTGRRARRVGVGDRPVGRRPRVRGRTAAAQSAVDGVRGRPRRRHRRECPPPRSPRPGGGRRTWPPAIGFAAGLARACGASVSVVDVGMAAPDPAVPDRMADAQPAARIDLADALDDERLAAAVQVGRDRADAAVDSGSDLLIGATCGVGVSTPVAALTAALTAMEPVDATSRGSGIDDNAWIRKAAAVRDALFRVRRAGGDALTMLRVGGGPDLAALTGFVAQAAIRRTPVIIHDMPSTVAAVLAHRLAPGADTYLIVSSLAPERGHPRLLDLLGREPLTDWSMTGHSGVGALLVLPSLLAAVGAFDDIDRDRPAGPLG